MELKYPNYIIPDFRHKKAISNSETMKSPPPSNTLRGSMCVHVLGGRGIFICGVCLEKISRDSPIIHVFFLLVFVESNGYQLPRSMGYIVHVPQDRGCRGGGSSDDEERAKIPPPPPPPRFCGVHGGREREVTET